MLARYLLSTITSKFGHLFEDFNEDTAVELSAWRGVLVLRNLHLRKDALKYLGVPLTDYGGLDGEGEDGEGALDEDDNGLNIGIDNDNGDVSDDDSFRSCASHIEDDDVELNEDKLPPPKKSSQQSSNSPTIEVTHGYIGSLEIHIPWKLLRATKASAASFDGGNEVNKSYDEDDCMKCSAVLSDVRILLAPNTHTRNQSKGGSQANYNRQNRDVNDSSSSTMSEKRKLQEVERIQRERELAVQSLIEREILRRVRGVKNGDDTDGKKADKSCDSNNVNETKEGWLARWAKGLVARILSSLQVTVQNIHVRYEDEGYGWFEDAFTSEKRHQYRPSFAVGMRLASFSIRSATANEESPAVSLDDNNGQENPYASIPPQHKIANVEQLSVYWDSSHSDLFVGYASKENDREYYDKRFAELDIMYADEFEGGTLQHTYLIHPISPSLQLMMFDPGIRDNATTSQQEDIGTHITQSPSQATASIHATLCLPSCHIGFDRYTLEDVAYVRQCLSAYKARIVSSKEQLIEHRISQELLDLKPPSGIRPGDNPRLWWKYAIRAVRTLQSDRSYFEGKSHMKERKWRRDGWLGLARLLRLRKEYTSLYRSLYWSSSQNDEIESKKNIHAELLSLEGMLNNEEITAFRMGIFSSLSESSSQNRDIRASESREIDELALRRDISIISVEYREMKLNQIVQSINSDRGSFYTSNEDSEKENSIYKGPDEENAIEKTGAPMWVISVACQNFTIQANDTNYPNNTLHQLTERQQIVPIARLQCLSSLRFDKFSNGSWDFSCAMSSLTVSDLISPCTSSDGQTLVGKKQPGAWGGVEDSHSDDKYTARITIRDVISNDGLQSQSTTYFDVVVSPLEVIYSTNAFEALSRLFTAMKTDEFNRDYTRITQALSRWRSRQGKRLMSVLARKKKLVASIDIAAPVLLIPEDLQNINSPMVVIDLGQLTFQSDFSEPLPFGIDDKWLLRIDSIRALCIQRHSQHAIIEPFSLEFSILTHIAESDVSDTDYTKINVQALLPQLCFNLTSSAVRLLLRLQMRWNELRNKTPVTQIPKRQTLHDFLLANRGLGLSQRQNSHAGLFDEFDKVDSWPSNDAPKVVQEMKVSFAAPSISLKIVNDIATDDSTTCSPVPLIDFSIRGIRGDNVAHTSAAGTSSQFSARLRSVHATDCTKVGSHFCHFLSSVDPGLLEDCLAPNTDMEGGDEDLVNVEMSTNPNGDKETSIHLQNFYVEWNPELLARVQKSLRLPPSELEGGVTVTQQTSKESEFFDALDTTDSYKSSESDGTKEVEVSPTLSPSIITPSSKFKVLFHLSKLLVNFNKDSQHRCLFSAEMNQTDISFCRKPLGGSITTATIANARLRDPDGMTGGSLYGQMIGLQQSSGFNNAPSTQPSSIVQMSFETFTNSSNDDEPEFHNEMKIEFSPMKFVYMYQFWLEIFDYFFEGILGHAVWGTKPKPSTVFFNPSEAMTSFKRTTMNIKMNQPLLLLPMSYRSPHHIRLKMNSLTVSSHFMREHVHKKEGPLTDWFQWYHKAKLDMLGVDILSWDERKLTNVAQEECPPSLSLNVQWPVGPTAPLIKPKWNIDGKIDPFLVFTLSQKDFSLFRFFVSYNIGEKSRFDSGPEPRLEDTTQVLSNKKVNLVLYGYEKKGVPPTTYSIKLSLDLLEFQFLLDEEESKGRKMEGIMNVNCTNASWSLVKNADCITRTCVNVESIRLTQTSKRHEWNGFPDLLLPLSPASSEGNVHTMPNSHCLLKFTSTTHPNGNNVKTLHLDAAGIYMIIPAWQYVGIFFQDLPTTPEVFAIEEMGSIMQVGDRFYRMSKSSSKDEQTKNNEVLAEVDNTTQPSSSHVSKQFLLTLTSPRIILVADATNQQHDCGCITLSMRNLGFLRKTNAHNDANTLFIDGLGIHTSMARNLSPGSSLLCPLSICGSLTKTLQSSPPSTSGWVWAEEFQARAAYTDLTHTIDVLTGVKKQMAKPSSDFLPKSAKSKTGSSLPETKATGEKESQSRINIDALCDGFNLVITDDSNRHFANAQPLVSVSLIGIRVSRVSIGVQESPKAQPGLALNQGQDLHLSINTFLSLDSLELTDLLRQKESPFRLIATSSQAENKKQHSMFSFVAQTELDAMSWASHKLIRLEWGFDLSLSMKKRHTAIHQLNPPSSYFDRSLDQKEHFLAFNSVLYDTGLSSIELNMRHLTAQWNPSTIIAMQRFLGRLKKAASSIIQSPTSLSTNSPSNFDTVQPPIAQPTKCCQVIFSVNARIESICICLNKEYQQRRLLDTLVSGVKIHFERYDEQSLMLEGSINKLRAWDPDTSKTTSDRNRHLLRLVNEDESRKDEKPFFSFRYRTFKTLYSRHHEHSHLPDWIENKIASGDIDDYLTIKMRPLELNYIRERTAELADYLNNGLPGKGMGATSKAAQSFCASRIRTRSFLDLVIDQPRLFIPRSSSSSIGGCYISLGTLTVTSWFEEACARFDFNKSRMTETHNLAGTHSFSFSSEDDESNKMDWWRVLDLSLGIGVKIEVDEPITLEGLSNPDICLDTNLTMRKPSLGETTVIQGNSPSLNINLKYREFVMLNLIASENMCPIDESKWDNIEKSYWQAETAHEQASADQDESILSYAESARIVRFGEAKTKSTDSKTQFGFFVDSISVTLHRDDWWGNLDEENAALLCYDICHFCIHNLDVAIDLRSNGNRTVSVALYDMSFTDLGDYGRLARDIYLGSNDSKRLPCAFSVVAEGYDKSASEAHDPLVSLVISTQTSHREDSENTGEPTKERKEVTKNVELKVNSLSITVLPRSIDDVLCFVSKKWRCPNSKNLDAKIALPSPKVTENQEEVTASAMNTLRFKFVAIYPRLILLADEYNPFSRALVLRGLAVGNMSIVRESSISHDMRSNTTLSGHVKGLETFIHNNVDTIIGPHRHEDSNDNAKMGVALIEPVTVTVELRIVSRTRFPTSRFVSVEIEPVSTLLSFSDLNLIETVLRKSTRKKGSKAHDTETKQPNPETNVQSPVMATKFDSLQLSRSSDYSVDDQPITFDVAILTKKLGLQLRKSGVSVVVESSLTNDKIEAGDVLLSVNGQSVERQTLASIVELFERSPRPLIVTLSRSNSLQQPSLHYRNESSVGNVTSSKSLSFDLSFKNPFDFDSPRSDDTGGREKCVESNQESQLFRYDLVCQCGKQNGLELVSGIGGSPVVNKVDYEVFARCAQAISEEVPNTDNIPSMIASKRMPLPGAVIVAINGKEVNGKELTFDKVVDELVSNESSSSTQGESSYTLSFVEVDSSAWGYISNFEGKLSFNLTVIDDTNGRCMPILRAGVNETSFIANHGLAHPTRSINARRPSLLSLDDGQNQANGSTSAVLSFESEISSFTLEYNNATINQWEPIIEPHYLVAIIEYQSGEQCSVIIGDHNDQSDPSPADFICINVSDSAVDILSKAVMNWRQCKPATMKTLTEVGPPLSPMSPTTDQSPIFGNKAGNNKTSSSAADLKKATKLAKLALNFEKRRGKIVHTDTEASPFVFKNRLGIGCSFSAQGMDTTVIEVEDGHDAKFQMNATSENSLQQSDRIFTRYDGQFPTVDIELDFRILQSMRGGRDVFADPITGLPTGKVGNTVRTVNIWKKNGPTCTHVSQQINVIWAVTLEEGRRVMTLRSATHINVFGCGDAFEIGVHIASKEDARFSGEKEITTIGTTKDCFFLPLWVESCFCEIDVFVRPSTKTMQNDKKQNVYSWSTFPVLCLKEDYWNADAIEVNYSWVTDEMASTLGGVSCPLLSTNDDDEHNGHHPVWLQCTYSKGKKRLDIPEPTTITNSQDTKTNDASTTSVTIWSAITIRNMLPCNVEWEVASNVLQNGTSNSIFDSSSKRLNQQHTSISPAEYVDCPYLKCGGAVEVFSADAQDLVYARFKCIVGGGCYWSEWICIGLVDCTMKKTFDDHAIASKQVNIQCRKNHLCDNPLTIGVKLSPHVGKGVNLLLYAEIWLRNLTSLPLTFGAPSQQLGSDSDMESPLPGKVSADSALIEISSVLEGNTFNLFGNDDEDDDDLGDDILNLPLQQCEEVYDEVFEYVHLNAMGNVERRWYASDNHLSRRQEPKGHDWLLDCAGEPFLKEGWETCANIAGSKSFTFNGRRQFNKNHRFRRRRWFRKIKASDATGDKNASTISGIIFHQPADIDIFTRSKREAERNAIGAIHLGDKKDDDKNGSNLLDIFNRPQQEGFLDIMMATANDGSILIHVKQYDGKWSTPAIIPPSGNSNGVIRCFSSRWPQVTKAMKEQRRAGAYSTWSSSDTSDQGNLGMAPLEPSMMELIYQVNVLDGLWGELSRIVTITPRFLIKNESSWLDIDVKQVGAPDTARVLIRKGEILPFYWCDMSLPELVCVRPAQRNRFKWSGGFDVCTLGMIPLRVRRIDGSIDQLNVASMRANVELQPGTGGSGTNISIRDEDPQGEGALFRVENHSPFQIYFEQEGVLANPLRNDTTSSCDVIQPHGSTSYALDIPWRQGKYTGRTAASMPELLLLRCALAPLSTRDGVETTKVLCFAKVGDYVRLSPSKLSSSIASSVATELLGVRVLGIVGQDGPTKVLRFVLMSKEVTASSYISNAMRDTISPMPSFISVESAPHDGNDDHRTKALQSAARTASQLLNAGRLPNEREAAKQAFFGTGICKSSSPEGQSNANPNSQEDGTDILFELSCSGFIFSFIDSSPSELAVLSLHDLKLEASWSSLSTEYSKTRVVVGWCQLDNHLPGANYPVAFRPKIKAEVFPPESKDGTKHDAKKAFTADKPFLEVMIDLAPKHRTGIHSLTAGVALHDVEILLDLAFILRIQRYLVGIQDHIMDALGTGCSFIDSQKAWELPNIEQLIRNKNGKTISRESMYFQRLTILPCKVKLSVAPSRALTKYQEEFEGQEASAIHAAVRKGDLLVGEGSGGVLGVKIGSKNRTAMSVVQGMMKSILVDALLRCDGASLNFEGVALFNHTSNSPQLVTYLGAHYLASLIANVPSLIGSLAAIGNPLGLVRGLGDGVSDFVNEPVKGFKRNRRNEPFILPWHTPPAIHPRGAPYIH